LDSSIDGKNWENRAVGNYNETIRKSCLGHIPSSDCGEHSMHIRQGRLFGRLFTVTALGVLLAACGSEPAEVPGGASLTVLVGQAERRDVPLSIDMVGATLGTQDVPIRARVEGFLESMDFDEGTFVKQGDLLYTIDPQPFQARLVEAQSMLAGAQTTLTKAQSDLERIRPLAEMHAVSEQDLDAAVAMEAAAQASVRASKANVDLANIDLSYTRIHAPIDGLIGLSKAKPGEFVGRDPNPVVLNVLSDIDPIRVRFSISEREYLIMARTYMANNTTDSRRDENKRSERRADLILLLADDSVHPQKGAVVAASQSIDQETGTYTIEAAFPNPTRILLPGQFARVRAPYQVLPDVVVVPRRAVTELQGFHRVYVVDNAGVVEIREITLGPDSGNDVVVETGLESGETVIIEGKQRVRPGMTVLTKPFTSSPSSP
jgi:membrane fusion protein (multidrug efflux system)